MTLPHEAPAWQPPHPPARRRHGPRAAVVVLVLLLLAALGVGAYLWLTTARWQQDSAAWETHAREEAERVAALERELAGVNAELVSAREQLATATDRITQLADEKARLGDENVASQQYLDYQTRVTEAAGVVATALGECIEAQSQLIGYLENRDAYDPADLQRFAGDVQGLCDQAKQANEQLRQELVG